MTDPEYVEIPLPLCACGQLPKPVENTGDKPVDNLASRARDSTPFSRDKSLSNSAREDEILGAILDVIDLLSARIDALEAKAIQR